MFNHIDELDQTFLIRRFVDPFMKSRKCPVVYFQRLVVKTDMIFKCILGTELVIT